MIEYWLIFLGVKVIHLSTAFAGETRSLRPRKLMCPPPVQWVIKLMRPSELQLQNATAHEL